MYESVFIPKNENVGGGKCFHTTFLIDDYYKIEEEETVASSSVNPYM